MSKVIRGTVRHEDGRPLAGARVFFTAGPEPLPDVAALTGSDGTFALTTPAEGTYGVAVAADGFESQRHTVRVANRSPVQLEIRLGTR